MRGAGLWPTGVHEPLQNAAPEVLQLQKAGSDAQGAQGRCVLDVRETLRNAAREVSPS